MHLYHELLEASITDKTLIQLSVVTKYMYMYIQCIRHKSEFCSPSNNKKNRY